METSYIGAQLPTGGVVVQEAFFETGAVATGTTIIPADDTVPQNTEGDEYMSLAFTPTDANNNLVIDVVSHVSHSTANIQVICALFKDTITSALKTASADQPIALGFNVIAFSHSILAGSTATQTFKVRIGGHTAGTTTFNGQIGARRFGGTAASSIRIQEVSPNRITPTGEIVVPNTKGIITTLDIATASHTQSITGVGFTPTGVDLICGVAGTSAASDGQLINATQVTRYHNASTIVFSNAVIAVINPVTGNQQVGVATLTADGVDIAWTKTGSPTGIANLQFRFYR